MLLPVDRRFFLLIGGRGRSVRQTDPLVKTVEKSARVE